MKAQDPKFSVGSLFICTKCGKDFEKPEFAEKLKTDLRTVLKNDKNDHLKVRVMTSSCLGVCQKSEQAFAFYPNNGSLEVFSTDPSESDKKIYQFIQNKLDLKN